jgi:hypothetical protein
VRGRVGCLEGNNLEKERGMKEKRKKAGGGPDALWVEGFADKHGVPSVRLHAMRAVGLQFM